MAIGINDQTVYDDLEEFDTLDNQVDHEKTDDTISQNQPGLDNSNQETKQEEDFISSLLKTRGIEDKTKIKFENDNGDIEEIDWSTLNVDDKLSILETSTSTNYDLDENEIELINTIRNSKMTPSEYLQYLEDNSINNYINNNSDSQQYLVDQYSDEELFIADLMSRMEDITAEEAQETLEKAMSNEKLFKKQITAIRNEYKNVEEENLRQEQLEQEYKAEEEYEEFTNSIIEQINNFTEFQGYDLNLEQEDLEQLLEFIAGHDAAGNNHFAKALADPKILVETAWFALNGKQMIQDITDYFQKEITKVRKESYKKGQEDAKTKGDKPQIIFKEQKNKSQDQFYSDLDEF